MEYVTDEKEVDQPYIAGYNRNKEANYYTSYGTKEDAKDNNITAYTRQDAKNSYITQYGDASKNSRMDHQEHVSLCFLKLISIEILFNSMDTLIFEFLFVGWSGGCN